jgi:ribosome-binding protein aMBF1 (putative translation factor)
MKSSNPHIGKRRRTFVRMLGEISHELNAALEEEHSARGLTITEIAKIIERHKSFVSRKFSGDSNMTLQTLADLAYALNRPVKVTLPSRLPGTGANHPTTVPRTSAFIFPTLRPMTSTEEITGIVGA